MGKNKNPPSNKPLRVADVAGNMVTGDCTNDEAMAALTLHPAMNAAMVVHAFQANTMGHDAAGITELVEALKGSGARVNTGDLAHMEAMLVAQATALQAIFTSYARRAQQQQFQRHLESFMGMALKAQAQSRATIQALVELKYPRQATFVRQANIAHGPQQVNNEGVFGVHKGAPPPRSATGTHAHAGESSGRKSRLLEDGNDGSTHLDTGTAAAATRGNPAMEAVGALNGADDHGREAAREPQRVEGRAMAERARRAEAAQRRPARD